MQQSLSLNLKTPPAFYQRQHCWLINPYRVFLGIIAIISISGCEADSKQSTVGAKIFTGVSLNLRCSDQGFGEVLSPAVQSWATRTGAKVHILLEAMTPDDNTDVGVISVPELGGWAERDSLTPVPAAIRAPDHPFQWNGLFPVYREQLIEWGGQARALPLAGDGFVVVYRTDRLKDPQFFATFQALFARKPGNPTTWEELANIATAFAKLDGKPSMGPLTNAELATLFFQNAACHDRIAQNESSSNKAEGDLGSLSFEFELSTGKPRLTTPAFVAAARWLEGLAANHCFAPAAQGTDSSAAAALGRNQAMIAVLSLGQLAHLPRENGKIPDHFALAPLPGTRTTLDPAKGQLVLRPAANYLPYLAGGRLGVVRKSCTNSTAAFDLLAELGGPTRSLEILASVGLGAGPFRNSHLDHDKLSIWYGYDFDADRTDQLRNALLSYVNLEAKNPAYGLRGPDQAPLNSLVASAMGKIAGGTPAETALHQLVEEWQQHDAETPAETLLRWRKRAAGLN
jgi:multiple sugar transport system substrate-binding protein